MIKMAKVIALALLIAGTSGMTLAVGLTLVSQSAQAGPNP